MTGLRSVLAWLLAFVVGMRRIGGAGEPADTSPPDRTGPAADRTGPAAGGPRPERVGAG